MLQGGREDAGAERHRQSMDWNEMRCCDVHKFKTVTTLKSAVHIC